jgi:hypothetical protein
MRHFDAMIGDKTIISKSPCVENGIIIKYLGRKIIFYNTCSDPCCSKKKE